MKQQNVLLVNLIRYSIIIFATKNVKKEAINIQKIVHNIVVNVPQIAKSVISVLTIVRCALKVKL